MEIYYIYINILHIFLLIFYNLYNESIFSSRYLLISLILLVNVNPFLFIIKLILLGTKNFDDSSSLIAVSNDRFFRYLVIYLNFKGVIYCSSQAIITLMPSAFILIILRGLSLLNNSNEFSTFVNELLNYNVIELFSIFSTLITRKG